MTKEEIAQALAEIDKEVDVLYNEGYTWEEGSDFFKLKFEEVYSLLLHSLENNF
nr:MAG TPA: hypothetical protein [Caudoviricetes sp.]